MIVWICAYERRIARILLKSVRCPVRSAKRRLKSSDFTSRAFCCSSRTVNSRNPSSPVLAISRLLAGDDLRVDPQLGGGAAQRFARHRRRDAGKLEEHAPGAHDRNPKLRIALARAHTDLGRLLGHRLVGKDLDPDFAATFDVARHGDSGRLDLTVGHPARLHRLQTEVAEVELAAAQRRAGHPSALNFAPLYAFGRQHLLAHLREDGLGDGLGDGYRLRFGRRFGWRFGCRRGLRGRRRRRRTVAARLIRQHLATIDPDFNSDAPERRKRFHLSVIDIGPQRVQRNLPVGVMLGSRDLRAAQAAGNLHFDPARAGAHGPHDRLFHGATKRDALLKLIHDVLGDQARVELGMLNLHHVDGDVFAGEPFEVASNIFDADAALADDDTGLGGVDDDARLIGPPFDLDLADRRRTHPPIERLTDRHVFVKPVDVVLFLEPTAIPGARDSQAHADRMYLLPHYASLDSVAAFSPAALLVCLRPPLRLRRDFAGVSAVARRAARGACTDAPALALRLPAGLPSLTMTVTCDKRLRLNAARP